MAVEPESFLKIYSEFKVPPEQTREWQKDRQGAIVGKDLAARYGWKLGDRVPLISPVMAAERTMAIQHRRHL